jgi:hypothetical protein
MQCRRGCTPSRRSPRELDSFEWRAAPDRAVVQATSRSAPVRTS